MDKESVPCFTVTEVTNAIKTLLEDSLPCTWIRGEVSQIKRYPSGHCYFTLKDENAMLNSIIWASYLAKIEHSPKEGEEIEAYGKLQVYAHRGSYNFIVYDIKRSGKGNIFTEFEKLKKKLLEEGLFDESRKRPLAKYPHTIAIVTGKDSAALRDIIAVAKQRYPLVKIKLFYSLVQGNNNHSHVINAMNAALEYSVTREKIDIVVIARGGGSIEDLWLFNNEMLARHISKFPIPVVTGIGHESDTTLADLVADKRFSTPTAAISNILPDANELRENLKKIRMDIYEKTYSKINEFKMTLDYCVLMFSKKKLLLPFENKKLILNGICGRILSAVKANLALLTTKAERCENIFFASNPDRMLQRGFSLTLDNGGKVIRKSKNVEIGSDIKVILGSGSLISTVKQKGE